MNKMVVTVFNNESSAYEGVKALNRLHDEGSISLHASAVIAKDAKGAVSVKQENVPGPFGTFFGLSTGSLIGLLGGPIGVAVGAVTGSVAGSMYDLAQAGIGSDFIDEVSLHLVPGKTAIVADLDEDWVTPLDSRMNGLGGIVVRRDRYDFIDAQIEREIAADEAELAQLDLELDQAAGEAKAKLQAKIDAVRQRQQKRREQLKERIEAIKREGEAKIKALQEQAAKAKGDVKAKLEARVAKARAIHEARARKLDQAWELVKEAAAIR
jgi:uncharacterized membrane protein